MIRFKLVFSLMAVLNKGLSFLMLFPLFAALAAKQYDSAKGFILYVAFLFITAFFGQRLHKKSDFDELSRLEGIVVVVLTWLIAALGGVIPYMWVGMGFIDAFFESMSGFTATGATIISDFSKFNSSIFWYRSYTQWLGGMGIMVLFVAVMPHLGISGRQLFYAETTSATKEKLTPRIADTARHLWAWYCFLTLIMVASLISVGMTPTDAVCNAFSTIAAGGFSPNAKSIMGYANTAVEWIIILFMFLAGANFMLQVKCIRKKSLDLFKNAEFKLYLGAIVFLSLVLAYILFINKIVPGSFLDSLRVALFQNISVTTTTGSVTQNYDLWPESAKTILVLFMFLGSCSGSAGGGIKIVRLLLMLKYLKRMLLKNIYPQAIINVKLESRTYKEQEIQPIMTFVSLYILFFFVGGILLSLLENNMLLGFSGAISTLGNIGPGFGLIGPMNSFANLTFASKIICVFFMWAGRLEIMAIAVFFKKEIWHNSHW